MREASPEGDALHFSALRLGGTNDLVLRGEIADPQANGIHASVYSPLQDSQKVDSAQMCGTCHDIETSAGGHIERTFQEWSGTIFAATHTTCAFNGNCHMASSPAGEAAATDMRG